MSISNVLSQAARGLRNSFRGGQGRISELGGKQCATRTWRLQRTPLSILVKATNALAHSYPEHLNPAFAEARAQRPMCLAAAPRVDHVPGSHSGVVKSGQQVQDSIRDNLKLADIALDSIQELLKRF